MVGVEAPSDIHNALAIVRSAEAFGLTRMHLIATEGKARKGWETSRGAMTWLGLRYHQSTGAFLESQRAAGVCVAGAVMDGERMLEDLPLEQPLLLLFGNEHRGLSQEALDGCDICFRIPMHGMAQSLNLSVAAATSLYVSAARWRQRLGQKGDLEGAALDYERAWCYVQSVQHRLLEALFTTPEHTAS
jgi:tRNA (guanosine-2'-O-)-methyltransferase